MKRSMRGGGLTGFIGNLIYRETADIEQKRVKTE